MNNSYYRNSHPTVCTCVECVEKRLKVKTEYWDLSSAMKVWVYSDNWITELAKVVLGLKLGHSYSLQDVEDLRIIILDSIRKELI